MAAWRQSYTAAFADFAALLKTRLIKNWKALTISNEEAAIADDIFTRLKQVALVNKYAAYQALDDEWTKIAVDLEILQTEGFDATRKVDPYMKSHKLIKIIIKL